MDVNPIFLIELLLFNGAVLAWAVYELWTVRKKPAPKPPATSASPDEPGHTEG